MGNLASSNLVSASFPFWCPVAATLPPLIAPPQSPATPAMALRDDASEASLPSSSSSASYASPPASPTKAARKKPQPIRLDSIGIDPGSLIGKVIRRIRPSPSHPAVTLQTNDDMTYQVRVDGYDPTHPGIPKSIEMNAVLSSLTQPSSNSDTHHLTVLDCRHISLKDTAFDGDGKRWTVEHLAIAFKFEEVRGWACCWATMAEYEGGGGPCTFRSFEDVYLEEMASRSPRKRRGYPRS